MPVNLSIKNAPDHIVERLRQRAAKNHRSLQGELMAIIEAATLTPKDAPAEVLANLRARELSTPTDSAEILRAHRDGGDPPEAALDPLTPEQFLARVRQMGLRTASDSVDIIRADRDRDEGR